MCYGHTVRIIIHFSFCRFVFVAVCLFYRTMVEINTIKKKLNDMTLCLTSFVCTSGTCFICSIPPPTVASYLQFPLPSILQHHIFIFFRCSACVWCTWQVIAIKKRSYSEREKVELNEVDFSKRFPSENFQHFIFQFKFHQASGKRGKKRIEKWFYRFGFFFHLKRNETKRSVR